MSDILLYNFDFFFFFTDFLGTKMSDILQQAFQLPLNIVLMLLLLPVMLFEYISDGLTMLASIVSLLQCEDRKTAFKFLTAYQTGQLIKEKFPNSIAVRS